jgi:hypothetical protein
MGKASPLRRTRPALERARKDAKDLERIEKERQQEEARRAAAQQRKKAQTASRNCKRLELRMKQARDDAKDAPLNHQQQADRKAAKAQENYDMECKAQK